MDYLFKRPFCIHNVPTEKDYHERLFLKNGVRLYKQFSAAAMFTASHSVVCLVCQLPRRPHAMGAGLSGLRAYSAYSLGARCRALPILRLRGLEATKYSTGASETFIFIAHPRAYGGGMSG